MNVSPATCHRRTQRLLETGAIRAVRAQIEPSKVDKGALAIVGVVLDRSTPESFAAFEAANLRLPFILDRHVAAGEVDYFLKIRVSGIKDFNRLHSDQLSGLPAMRRLRTFLVLTEVVDSAPLEF